MHLFILTGGGFTGHMIRWWKEGMWANDGSVQFWVWHETMLMYKHINRCNRFISTMRSCNKESHTGRHVDSMMQFVSCSSTGHVRTMFIYFIKTDLKDLLLGTLVAFSLFFSTKGFSVSRCCMISSDFTFLSCRPIFFSQKYVASQSVW